MIIYLLHSLITHKTSWLSIMLLSTNYDANISIELHMPRHSGVVVSSATFKLEAPWFSRTTYKSHITQNPKNNLPKHTPAHHTQNYRWSQKTNSEIDVCMCRCWCCATASPGWGQRGWWGSYLLTKTSCYTRSWAMPSCATPWCIPPLTSSTLVWSHLMLFDVGPENGILQDL